MKSRFSCFVSSSTMAKGKSSGSETMCTICMGTKTAADMYTSSGCVHSFCTDCISQHIDAKIEDNIANVMCPEPNCKAALEPETCDSFLPKEVLERWGDALCEAMILGMQTLLCPFVDCSATMIDDVDKEEVVTAVECPCCRRMFCLQCEVEWHEGVECEKLKLSKKLAEILDALMTMELAERMNWKKCPHCKIYVERIQVCPHIICKCGFEFCYSCGEKWGDYNHKPCMFGF